MRRSRLILALEIEFVVDVVSLNGMLCSCEADGGATVTVKS